MEFIMLGLGLSIGNYFYQFLNDKDWKKAFERSYFQMVACLLCWMIAAG